MANLLCVRGPLKGIRLPLAEAEATIGRGGECTLVMPDSTISRVHARFRKHRDGWLLDDLGSAHGTFLNGREVGQSFPLAPNDEIRLGHSILLFETPYGVARPDFTEQFVYTTRNASGHVPEPVAVLDLRPAAEGTPPRELNAFLATLFDGTAAHLPQAAAQALGHIARYFKADSAAILLEDPATLESRLIAAHGRRSVLLDGQTVSRACRQHQALLVTDRPVLKKHPAQDSPSPPKMRSLMVAPLYSGNACLGALALQRDELDAYAVQDLHLARAVARLLTVYLDMRGQLEVLARGPHLRGEGLLYGTSAAMKRLRERLMEVAPEPFALISGERGARLELAARELHRLQTGGNPAAPFLVHPCREEPDPMFEAELFGQERGAFGGATETRQGLVELARGGTVYLAEIAAASADAQERLLQYLRCGAYTRAGGAHPLSGGARLIAGTRKNLEEEVQGRRFSGELYKRLAPRTVTFPPLRERPEDIAPLAEHYLRQAAAAHHTPAPELDSRRMEQLAAQPWPGNERELAIAMERIVLQSSLEGTMTEVSPAATPTPR